MSVLVLDRAAKSFGARRAVEGFSLEVLAGERVALLGPSGCGKTTVLRLLAGFEVPDAGRVVVGNETAAADGRMYLSPENRNLGMVFQDLALWPHLTVWENLAFGLRAHRVHKAERARRIHEMLGRVELTDYAHARPATLSGGQQQRVAFARALVLRPRALLMDEPLSSLDYELNLRLRAELLALHRALGFAFVYVTHDRDEAFALAQRIVLMEHGRAVAVGSPDEIRECLGQSSRVTT